MLYRAYAQVQAYKRHLIAASYYVGSALLVHGGYAGIMALLMYLRDPAQVAYVTLGYSVIMFSSTVASWGMRQPYAIWCMKADMSLRAAWTWHAGTTIGKVATPSLLIGALVAHAYAPRSVSHMVIIMVGALAVIASELFVQYTMYTSQPRRYVQYKVGHLILWAAGALVCLSQGGGGLACLAAYVCATMVMVLWGWYMVWRAKRGALATYPDVRYWWLLGVQYVPTLLASGMMAYSNRWLLFQAGMVTQVAYWSVLDFMGPLFQATVLQVLNALYWPDSIRRYTLDDISAEQHTWWSMKIASVILVCGGAVGWSLVCIVGPYVLPAPYAVVLPAGYGVLLAHSVHAVSYMLMPRLHAREQLWPISVSLVVGSMTHVVAGWFLVRRYSIYGCVGATLLGQIVYIVLLLVIRARVTSWTGRVRYHTLEHNNEVIAS